MDPEVLARFNSFSLSAKESDGMELSEVDVGIGLEEGNRSLLGKIFGENRANFLGVKNTMMKLWQNKGLCKVVCLTQNVFQFVFKEAWDREVVLQGRPWLFDNYLLVLHQWEEDLKWTDECFNFSPFWVQVWNIPTHWMSLETGRKIGNQLGTVKDVMLVESGGKEERFLKILVVIDLTKPLQRGTKLKYRQSDSWVDFRYEQLPIFCFYCGQIGHNERLCLKRGEDVERGCVRNDQFGYWLKAGSRKIASLGNRKEGMKPVNTPYLSMRGTGEEVSIGQEGELRGGSAILQEGDGVRGKQDSTRGDERVLGLDKSVEVRGVDVSIGEGGYTETQ